MTFPDDISRTQSLSSSLVPMDFYPEVGLDPVTDGNGNLVTDWCDLTGQIRAKMAEQHCDADNFIMEESDQAGQNCRMTAAEDALTSA